MTCKRLIYILTLATATGMMSGCSDDFMEPTATTGSSNVVAFVTGVGSPQVETRSAGTPKPLYEPLELTNANGDETLYLHTYDAEMIGFDPAANGSGAATRGVQVTTVGMLEDFHGNFMVKAAMADNMEEYIPWIKSKPMSKHSDIWLPDKTRYWPSQDELAFHAFAPASEQESLKGLTASSPLLLSFDYEAKKGAEPDADAEAQTDLLVAASQCNKAGSINGHAPMKFHHALSAIKFAVRDVMNGTVVNVKIKDIYGKAHCVYTAAADGTNGHFQWSEHDGKTTYSQDFNYELTNRGYVDVSSDANDLVLTNGMPTKVFMVVPQVIPDGARIEVTIHRTGIVDQAHAAGIKDEITVSADITQNDIKEWEAGHEYIYTISTSKDNWVYVLEAYGNHNGKTPGGSHSIDGSLNGNYIYGYSPAEEVPNSKPVQYFHKLYGDNGYVKVLSYRFRANDYYQTEPVKWTATNTGSKGYSIKGEFPGTLQSDRYTLTGDQWILSEKSLGGDGGTEYEVKKFQFESHHVKTTWPGDDWMQEQSSFKIEGKETSKDKPWDLSTCNRAKKPYRNTANCYVIDREGWYMFPVVYGNAIKDGETNTSAFTYEGTGDSSHLKTLVDHLDQSIKGPWISSYHTLKEAKLLWADAFNIISDVKLTTINDEQVIVFHANKQNLQQGNVVIGLYDNKDRITWSWHIWINEHWLDEKTGRPHVYNQEDASFEFKPSSCGWRNRGDVKLTTKHVMDGTTDYNYWIAPYNVGWCDPKSVDYLRRVGTMTVTQSDTGKTVELPMIQEGARIDYRYGNNTYYQWGRKDPTVGFIDHEDKEKPTYGDNTYDRGNQGQTLGYAIQHPNVLFCMLASDHWLGGNNYKNLWNNSTDIDKITSIGSLTPNASQTISHKTVYDPCPPGYKVPTGKAMQFIGTTPAGSYTDSGNQQYIGNEDKIHEFFNGTFTLDPKNVTDDEFLFKACADDKENQKPENTIWLTSTGQRWYTNTRPTLAIGGGNFNSNLVYLFSCVPRGTNGLSIALGFDRNFIPLGKPDKEENKEPGFCITSYFLGRMSQARPVRPIRE